MGIFSEPDFLKLPGENLTYKVHSQQHRKAETPYLGELVSTLLLMDPPFHQQKQ